MGDHVAKGPAQIPLGSLACISTCYVCRQTDHCACSVSTSGTGIIHNGITTWSSSVGWSVLGSASFRRFAPYVLEAVLFLAVRHCPIRLLCFPTARSRLALRRPSAYSRHNAVRDIVLALPCPTFPIDLRRIAYFTRLAFQGFAECLKSDSRVGPCGVYDPISKWTQGLRCRIRGIIPSDICRTLPSRYCCQCKLSNLGHHVEELLLFLRSLSIVLP